MSTDTQTGPKGDTKEVITSALGEISHLATLPEVTLRIIKLVEDPKSTAADLNQVISHDPALGARILKVVNSAFYGLPGQIGSINRAIVLLGLNAVKNIAIAASLAKLFRGGKICPHFDARDLWAHSIATASATQLLAKRVGLGLPDEAFLAGLIHDLGVMVEIQARRSQFVEAVTAVVESRKGDTDPNQWLTMRHAEMRYIGATHEQFGAALCKVWKFPASFASVTGYHHRPMDLPPEARSLTALVYVAEHIAFELDDTLSYFRETPELDPRVLDEMKLTAAGLEEVKLAVPEAIEEAKAVFQNPEA